MESIRMPFNPSGGRKIIERLIENSAHLLPVVYADISVGELVSQIASNNPTFGRSVDCEDGTWKLDLGSLVMRWLVQADDLGSCIIFFVFRCDAPYGLEQWGKFMDELKAGREGAGYEVGILDPAMYQAPSTVCRILGQEQRQDSPGSV